MTITEKILASHAGLAPFSPGQLINARIDMPWVTTSPRRSALNDSKRPIPTLAAVLPASMPPLPLRPQEFPVLLPRALPEFFTEMPLTWACDPRMCRSRRRY